MSENLINVDLNTVTSQVDVGSALVNKRNGLITAGVVCAGLITFGIVNANTGESSANDTSDTVANGYNVENGCDNLTDAQAARNGDNYIPEAFLPGYDGISAKAYVDMLFDQDGPLSNKGDLDSLAAFMATVTSPANDGKEVNPDYNYSETFKNKVAQYKSDGLGAAREDCALSYDTAVQTAQYANTWEHAGATVTAFHAVRDADNNIIDMIPQKIVLGEDLSGVSFMVRGSSEGVDGFTEVLVSKDGIMYVKGITVGEGARAIGESEETVSVDSNADVTVAANPSTSSSTELTVPANVDTSSSSSVTPNATPATVPATTPANGTTGGGSSSTGGNGGVGPTPSTPDAPGAGITPVDVPATNGTTPNTAPGTTAGTTPNTAPGTTAGTTPNTAPNTTQPGTTAPETTQPATTAPNTTQPPITAPPTTAEQLYEITYCDIDAPRNEGGYGVVMHLGSLTLSQLNAIKADTMNKLNFTNLGDSNGDGQVICK